MLQALRKGSKSWLAKGLMITLAGAFGLWGINDIFRGTSVDNTVATVGDQTISVTEYDRELRAEMRNLGQRLHTDMTLEQARTQGITKDVLDHMISRTALDTEVKKLGLTVDNNTMAAAIRALPQFEGQGGTFSRVLLDEALQQNGLTEAGFEQSMRQDMARSQLMDSTVDWLGIPPEMSQLFYNYLNQQRVAEYLVLTPEQAGTVRAPTDAELEAYYKANAQRFSTPEYRELEYVAIGVEQFADKVEVSEADMKKEYDAHKETYVKPEEREIQQINFPSKETAEAAHQQIVSGTDFLSVAHGMGLKDDDVKLGTFPKSGLNRMLADAAFALPEGGVSPPVQGPFGWVMLRVTKVTPGVNKTYEDLKATLREQLAKTLAAVKAVEAVNAFEDARGAGAPLEEAAKKVGLTAVHIAAVDRTGLTPDGTKADVPVAAAFLQQAFAAEAGEEGDIFQSDDLHSYAIRVIGVRPPAPKPLAQIREQVVKEWTEAERAKMLAARAKSLTEEASKSGGLAAVAQALGHQPTTSAPLRRDTPNEIFSRPALADLFSTPPGGTIYGPLGKGQGYVIARVVRAINPDPSASPVEFENNKRQIAQQIASDLIESMSNAARETAGAKINDAAYSRIVGGSQ